MPGKVWDFTKTGDAVPVPSLTEIQTRSYADFLQAGTPPDARRPQGLEALFRDILPVRRSDGAITVEYVRYELGHPLHTEEACRRLRLTYGYPLHAVLRVVGADTVEERVYLGDVPRMIGGGEFIIHGAERVVVAQIQRSPGVDLAVEQDSNGRKTFSCRMVPERGTWIEFSIGSQDYLQVRVGQSGKMPGTWLLRALLPEAGSDEGLLGLFYERETAALREECLGDLVGRRLAAEIADAATGEVWHRAGVRLDENDLRQMMRGGLAEIVLLKNTEDPVILNTLERDITRSHGEAVLKIYERFRPGVAAEPERALKFLRERLQDPKRYSLGPVGRFRMNRRLGLTVAADAMILRHEDVLATVRRLLALRQEKDRPDDIDHLGNRILRPVGKLAEAHLREGFMRLRRAIENSLDMWKGETTPSPRALCDSRPLTDALDGFFGRGELSQVVDQTNPLAQLANERRVTALGPGGLNRKRASFEVRDVHVSHYGRLCPIETPEGPNIGLISYLSLFARLDEHGFLTTPFAQLNGKAPRREVVDLRADEEGDLRILPAGGVSEKDRPVVLRQAGEFVPGRNADADLAEISPKQIVGVSASLVPFLEHDDANRALMGANMQRQAVPLLAAERALVHTGMERVVAESSGLVVRAERDGVVLEADGAHVLIAEDAAASPRLYRLRKFRGLNEGTCLNQRPIVQVGQRVRRGDILADGPATVGGELALGRNVLVAFAPWDGFNFEDAVLVSERVIQDGAFTSVHIQEFEAQVRETRLGREEITRDIPGVGLDALARLGEDGVIAVGTVVREGDILVGKVTPKAKTELTPEDQLVRAIFGRAGEDVKNESLVAPPGCEGVVVDVARFARKLYIKEDERRRAEEEAGRIEEQTDRLVADEFLRLLERLRGLPLARGAALPAPVGGLPQSSNDGSGLTQAEARRVISAEQSFRFSPDWFRDDARERAVALYGRYSEWAAETRADCDQRRRCIRMGDDLPPGVLEMVKVYVAVKRHLQVGDKIAGRHGNKGVIARIASQEDMPFLPDGTPVDIVLNPLGVPSRMNLGQILETHLGWAARALGYRALCPVFDGATEDEIRDRLTEAGLPRTGKTVLYDGRTGDPFDQEVTVGCLYMIKLDHLVEDKTHARSTGPYSLITQQPLGGKSRRGGQRVGEMEVWALEAHGAAHLLQEMLTVKSDDVEGRAIMYERLIKGRNYLEASRPVSFDVAVSEIRGLCLNLQMEKLGRVQDVRAEAAAGGDDIPAGGETSPGIAQETAGLLPGVVEDDAEAAEDDGRAVALDQPEQAEQTAQREE